MPHCHSNNSLDRYFLQNLMSLNPMNSRRHVSMAVECASEEVDAWRRWVRCLSAADAAKANGENRDGHSVPCPYVAELKCCQGGSAGAAPPAPRRSCGCTSGSR